MEVLTHVVGTSVFRRRTLVNVMNLLTVKMGLILYFWQTDSERTFYSLTLFFIIFQTYSIGGPRKGAPKILPKLAPFLPILVSMPPLTTLDPPQESILIRSNKSDKTKALTVSLPLLLFYILNIHVSFTKHQHVNLVQKMNQLFSFG